MMAVGSRPFGLHYGYVALAAGAVALMATLGFGRWAYSLILPGMREGLTLTYTQMGILSTGNMVGYLAAVPVAGIAASRYGSRLVIGASMLVAGVALLCTGLSPNFELAFVALFLAGIASAGAIVPSMALAGIWVAPQKRGVATGLVNTPLGLAFFVTGPVIPGLAASSTGMGWRYGWYLVGAVVLLGGVLVAVLMRNRPRDLGLQVMGATGNSAAEESPASPLNWGLVYRSGRVWHLAVLYGLFGFSFAGLSTFFAAFLRDQGGLTEGVIGSMWALSGVGMAAGCLAWGYISDRVGRAAGIAIVFLFLAGSIIVFTLSRSLAVYYLSALFFWAAEPGVPVIVAAACADYVGGRLAPAAVGFATLFMGVGQAVGPVLAGSLADITASFDTAFYLSAAVAFLGMVGAFFLRRPGAQL